MRGLGQSIATGAIAGSAIGGPLGTALGVGIGFIGGISSLFSSGSKQKEAKDQINILTGQRTSAISAMGELADIESQKIGIAEDQYGTAESKAMFGVGSSLYGVTRAGMTASSNIGFAKSGQLNKTIDKSQRDIVSDFGFQKQGLQDLLGQNLLNISEEVGSQRSQLETQIASIDSQIKINQRKSSAGGFLQSFLGG